VVQIDKKSNSLIIRLRGLVGIQDAKFIYEKFKSVLAGSEEIYIDLKETSEVDISCLQLIWTFILSAKKIGKRVRFSIHNVDDFKKLIKDTGLLNSFFPTSSENKQIAEKVE